MQRSDYLNPEAMKNQCMKAVRRMKEDGKALKTAGNSIMQFAQDREIESESFEALKQQLEDYKIILEAMEIANGADAADFQSLSELVGSETLDGENIFRQMENALNMKESYLAGEALYRNRMAVTQEAFSQAYYGFKANQYSRLAENSQRLYERWREKTELFDEIGARTSHLFTDSEGISGWIQTGLSQMTGAFQKGAYMPQQNSIWRRQIKNAGVRLAMGFGDKGGEQNGPYTLWRRGMASDREFIREIVHGYEEYENYSDEEIEDLLIKLNSEGCGYVAFANIIVDEYRRKEEEFETLFGFPLFLENRSGTTYVNYNRLIVDLYCASDNHRKVWNMWQDYDIYDEEEDPSVTIGWGTTMEDRVYRFERYMAGYGKKVKIENIKCQTDEVYLRCKEEAELGKRVIISTCPVRMEDAQGEPVQMDGGHAMVVTGLTDDGRIQVSSWGELYYISPEDSDFISPEKNRLRDAYIRIQSVRFENIGELQ